VVNSTGSLIAYGGLIHPRGTIDTVENLAKYSEQFDQSGTWVNTAATVTADYEAGPDGTPSVADRLQGTGNPGSITQTISAVATTANRTFTAGLWIKNNTASWSSTMRIDSSNITGTSTYSTGSVAGWRYVSVTQTFPSNSTGSPKVVIATSAGSDISIFGLNFSETSSAIGYTATGNNTVSSMRGGTINGRLLVTGANYDVGQIIRAGGNQGTTNLLEFQDNTGAALSVFTANGSLGIGTTSPAKALQFIGDIRVGTSGTNGCVENFAGSALAGVCSSDASLKTNIQPLGSVLPGLVQLTPSTFYWNDIAGNELHNSTTTLNYGLVAQDVARVLPGMVATTSNGYLGVNYSMLPILTLQGLKELDLNLEGLASTTATTVDLTGNKTFVGRFFDRMTGWFADAANGVGDFFANRVHTKTLCVGDKSTGETCITKDQLDALLSGSSISNNAAVTPSATTTPVTASENIIISINGNNPATIKVGDTYGDLGALIISPESAKNFGIKASLDGGMEMDISQISIDTTIAGSHKIVYSVVDQTAATTTAERIVNIVSPEPIIVVVETPSDVATSTDTTTAEAQ
jgi:hypothetical protein